MNNNIDFERTMIYTRKQGDDNVISTLQDTNNSFISMSIRKPLPINYNSNQKQFLINPITGMYPEDKDINRLMTQPDFTYQSKKQNRLEIENRISSYSVLPHTQNMPVLNNVCENNPILSDIPVNTRIKVFSYGHFNR